MAASSTSSAGLVNFTLKIGGSKLNKNVLAYVTGIVMDKTINKIPYAKITLIDGDPSQSSFPISNSDAFKLGQKIDIEAGYGTQADKIFQGIIVKHEIRARSKSLPFLIVVCRDAAYKTTLVPKTKCFQKAKDSAAMQEILGTYSGVSKEVKSTSIEHEELLQQEVTDWDFLNLRAEANGMVLMVDDGKVDIGPPKEASSGLSLTYGQNMYEFDMEIDARSQWKGAAGKTWNPDTQAVQDVAVSEPGEKSFGKAGYSALANANDQKNAILYHSAVLAEKEMETLAKGLLERSRLSKIQGRIKIQGVAAIKPNQAIKIEKGADNFQGKAYVAGVHHEIKEGNWFTTLKIGLPFQRYITQYHDVVGLPAAGMLAPVHGLQLGTVKQVHEDPKKTFRVQVCLPMMHESSESIWCRIASFYASKAFGAFFMPEVGDEVVVGFVNDDPRHPIVVGSLYSKKNTPPVEVYQENSQKVFLSKENLMLSFNEKDKEIIIQTPKNQNITISDKDGSIKITDADATNSMTMSSSGISLESKKDINIKADGAVNVTASKKLALKADSDANLEGMNVNLKGEMAASIQGGESTEIKSSGIMTIKGSEVMIN